MDDESSFCLEERSKGVLMKGVNLDVNDLIKLESCIEEWSYIEYFEGIDELRIINNLQVACKKGDLQRVEKLIGRGLHIAAESGEIDVINLILKYCPESAEKTRKTCLHVAVKHNQSDVVLRRLLKWVIGERPRFLHVLDFKDHKTATSAKQYYMNIPALRVFLPLNSGSSVAMDISYDLSYLSFLGIRWEPRAMITWDLTKHKIKHTNDYNLRGLSNSSRDFTIQIIEPNDDYSHRGLSNGSRDFTIQIIKPNDDNGSRDLTKEKVKHNDNCSSRGLSNGSRDFTIQIIEPNDDHSHRGLLNCSSNRSTVEPSVRFKCGLLLIAALIATTTLQVPFHFRGSTSKEGYEQHSIMRSLIIWCNSLVFIASVGVIAFLLPEFPLKPLSHNTIFCLFGVYMLQLNEIMPNGALVLFFISSPILLVGICREALWLCKPKTHLSTSGDVSSC
ncbi:hypothetical protein LOK49_LG01G00191 [Camellia lanceoleosa]|uniref:Uncharacterized protein n=1 Tax=Camellia lanceoleosa TaxID=1840588 RepID=A0ACC0J5M8_9ERIC|nr:hypothetical protein LOK49_LG01G00191 [Camellia lanceoleosa]